MAGGQKLEDAAVIALQKEMFHKYENIRKRMHGLQGVIDGLEGKWHGIARAEFDKKQYELNESLARIGVILTDVIEAMSKTRNLKDDSEDEIRGAVKAINLLDGASTVDKPSALNSY